MLKYLKTHFAKFQKKKKVEFLKIGVQFTCSVHILSSILPYQKHTPKNKNNQQPHSTYNDIDWSKREAVGSTMQAHSLHVIAARSANPQWLLWQRWTIWRSAAPSAVQPEFLTHRRHNAFCLINK